MHGGAKHMVDFTANDLLCIQTALANRLQTAQEYVSKIVREKADPAYILLHMKHRDELQAVYDKVRQQ
jgi:hypothetical protein